MVDGAGRRVVANAPTRLSESGEEVALLGVEEEGLVEASHRIEGLPTNEHGRSRERFDVSGTGVRSRSGVMPVEEGNSGKKAREKETLEEDAPRRRSPENGADRTPPAIEEPRAHHGDPRLPLEDAGQRRDGAGLELDVVVQEEEKAAHAVPCGEVAGGTIA
jgi:hypothetical protein